MLRVFRNVSKLPSCVLARGVSVDVAPSVKKALVQGRPVVALETTIITHGMPAPKNVETALQVQEIIRQQGAEPATIGIIGGRIKVGLTEEELRLLADPACKAVKVSRRDLPLVVAKELHGGTTVAATMVIAHKAGIPVFVTGGIGGVHRGGENSWDVSADLRELGRTPVAVICSGVKSILDIGRTLEVLETEGVGVATFGPDPDFPAFYCRKSGFKSPCQLRGVEEAVRYVSALHHLKLDSGVLIAVPVPEEHALNSDEVEKAIASAIAEAKGQGVTGPKVTPFILKRVANVTSGQALAANIALIKNNAEVGAKIAVGLSASKSQNKASRTAATPDATASASDHKKVTVIGGSVLDLVVRVTGPDFKAMNLLYSLRCHDTASIDNRRISPLKAWMCAHASSSLEKYKHLLQHGFDSPMVFEAETPQRQFVAYIDPENKFATEDKLSQADGSTLDGEITWSGGGVGRNIADALTKLGAHTHFVSAVGKDHFGEFLTNETLSHLASHTLVTGTERTPICMVVCDNEGNSRLLVGDMRAFRHIDKSALEACRQQIISSALVVMDGNVPPQTMEYIFQLCQQHSIPVFFEPTDTSLAAVPFQISTSVKPPISFISPNVAEFVEITQKVLPHVGVKESDSLECLADAACQLVERTVDNVIVTLGPEGVLIARRGTENNPFFSTEAHPKLIRSSLPVSHRVYTPPPFPSRDIVNVSGAGDCFASGFIVAMLRGLPEPNCVSFGFQASQEALKSFKTVPENLSALAQH